MAKERGKRIYRKATDEERKRHAKVREQIKEELPDIKRRARQRLALIKKEGTPLRHVLAALRAERERQGLSLADINERTGIDRAALSRLENNEESVSRPEFLANSGSSKGCLSTNSCLSRNATSCPAVAMTRFTKSRSGFRGYWNTMTSPGCGFVSPPYAILLTRTKSPARTVSSMLPVGIR